MGAESGCDGNSKKSFDDCVEELRLALSEDVLWNHVTAYFGSHNLNVRSFSYNTFAAMASKAVKKGDFGDAAFAGIDSSQDDAYVLRELLTEKCNVEGGLSLRFGFRNSNQCMKAWYVSLYTTSFFHKWSRFENSHTVREIHFDGHRAWAEGVVDATSVSSQGPAVIDSRRLTDSHHVLRVHSADYMHGAAIHFSAGLEKYEPSTRASFDVHV